MEPADPSARIPPICKQASLAGCLIKHRCRYVRKQKVSDPYNTSKDDDLDLLGDDMEVFSGSQADLEGAANNLFS